jgi:hypothetical protein
MPSPKVGMKEVRPSYVHQDDEGFRFERDLRVIENLNSRQGGLSGLLDKFIGNGVDSSASFHAH